MRKTPLVVGSLATFALLLAVVLARPDRAVEPQRIAELLTVSSDDICRHPITADRSLRLTADGDDPLPVDIEIGPAFRLVDQSGAVRTRGDLIDGRLSLLIFGYASCEGVCLLALPAMADAVAILNQRGVDAQPVLVTVDPERDTPEALAAQLAPLHERFVGLTGPTTALASVRRMFSVRASPAFEDDKGTVYQHGSYIFVIDANGEVQSLLPPVLPPQQIAEIALKYAL